MKVNMTPNPLDVVTIHASQGDTEARQWEFELHNNGELIDTSDVKEQLFFKAYKGGTEQILPENGSVPTTSPIIADIKYPHGELTDQEFLYRQSPTEEDGLAKITDIKGNTLKWNQLVQNGNFVDTSNWYARDDATLTVSNNVGTLVTTNQTISAIMCRFSYVQNHKYLIKLSAKSSSGEKLGIGITNNNGTLRNPSIQIIPTTSWEEYSVIGLATLAPSGILADDGLVIRNMEASSQTVELKNVQVFDLTQMGLDTLTDAEVLKWFADYFPLSYYSYNQGSLLSFNGNGIKTVGNNLFDKSTPIEIGQYHSGVWNDYNTRITTDYIRIIPNIDYTMSIDLDNSEDLAFINYNYFDGDKNWLGSRAENGDSSFAGQKQKTFNIHNSSAMYVRLTIRAYSSADKDISSVTLENAELQLEFGSSASSYEPYTSSTLSLPISTYFPNGMKSAKNAYDELSDTKATVRIKSLTVNGSEAWVKSTSYPGNYYVLGLLSDVKYPDPNAISNSLILVYNTTQLSANDLCFMFDGSANSQNVNIKNTSMTTVDQFKAWLQSNPVTIYYELKTPTETPITTASLVTENAEIPLSNEDGTLIGKCTEELSAEPGFHDAKIKLSDSDGTCYSNKLQLHVERSPQ